MIQVRTRIIDHSENDIQPITQSEENALRYAAGYVVRKVTENIEHSKRPLPLKLKLLSGLEMLRDENSSEHPHDSSVWIDMIDRAWWTLARERYSVPSVLCNGGRDEKTSTST